jgi:hypothetical protein
MIGNCRNVDALRQQSGGRHDRHAEDQAEPGKVRHDSAADLVGDRSCPGARERSDERPEERIRQRIGCAGEIAVQRFDEERERRRKTGERAEGHHVGDRAEPRVFVFEDIELLFE